MKKEIRDYIIEICQGTDPNYRTQHFSYCSFPGEDCSCKDISFIKYDTSLIRDGYVDSFSMVEVLDFIEVKFDVKIPIEEATPDNFDTINRIVELINKHK